VPALRDADRPGVVHEPVELQLPAVPAAAAGTRAPEHTVSNRVRAVAVVRGRVQGVGYRAFVDRLAAGLDLAGSATNLPDGRVRVVAEGPDDDVRALVQALSGPDAPGRVDDVQQRAEDPQGLTGFTVG
jgi:acylphosphatase